MPNPSRFTVASQPDEFKGQMPLLSSSNSFTVSVSEPDQDDPFPSSRVQSSGIQSPAGSLDLFATAPTSPSERDQAHSATTSRSTSYPLTPSSLRKSISVDSFVHYGRDYTPTTTRQTRGQTNSALDSLKNLRFDATQKIDRDRRLQTGRLRGASVSSVQDERTSVMCDSDVERSDILNMSIDGYSRIYHKAQDRGQIFVTGGELPLPSRTPTLSTTSSMSSILTASTSSSTTDGAPAVQSTSSLQSLAKRNTPPTSMGGRSRSGSLGMHPPSTRRMVINTSLPGAATLDHPNAITLVVVGVAGCGKSVVIRKGLKGYGLSEPTPSLPGSHSLSRYSRRLGRISKAEDQLEWPLIVYEVDIPGALPDTTLSVVDFLPDTTRVDAVIICYDASNEASFRPVEALLRGCREWKLPLVVVACKSDLSQGVDPQAAVRTLRQYEAGLVEVNNVSDTGREKMRRSFEWLLKAILRDRMRNSFDDYRNPASPDLVASPSWEGGSRTVTPTVSSTSTSFNTTVPPTSGSTLPAIPSSRTPNSPPDAVQPTRIEMEPAIIEEQATDAEQSHGESHGSIPPIVATKPIKSKETRPAQWATLDELLDKLMFLAVSGDDPSYITHFLLTYRRFASPRSVLLAMQKRMRQLDNPSGDPMFACYAQMRICHLLELWIRDYPYDFAVRGTAGALSALIKSIISKTYLLHYGADFLPFLEMLPSLADKDADWALKVDDTADESDDSYSLLEEEDDKSVRSAARPQTTSPAKEKERLGSAPPVRERKGSLPLTAKALIPNTEDTSAYDHPPETPKQQLRDLQRLAQDVNNADPEELAKEITRLEAKMFLDIEPRHWLHYTFVSGKKNQETNSIAHFNSVSNLLADWVVSLILCHDKPRMRAKQIEKLVEIAQKLRSFNNYSALRAFVAGINNSTYPGDQTMEQFKARCPEQAKNLQSWDVLLQHIRSHRAYRLALRNTKGACIPALEVHISDLIRSHEANDDFNSDDRTKIHWGKFNMMGRFITSTTQCQAHCRSTSDYDFPNNDRMRKLLLANCLMDDEMQKSRIAPPEGEYDDYHPNPRPPRDAPPRDVAILRKLLFW